MCKLLRMILLGVVFLICLMADLWADPRKPRPAPVPFHHRFGKPVRVRTNDSSHDWLHPGILTQRPVKAHEL